MAKALVIKGVDFSTNKVTTVSFGGDVPCTGIELSESSISIDDYDPVEVEYTLTPANTTDVVTLESSDENVAIFENGNLVPVGVGTCTITATCGNCSDTAEVSVSLAYIPAYVFGSIAENGDAPNSFPAIQPSYNRISLTGSGVQAGTYKCLGKNGFENNFDIIKLPKNVASITVKNTTKSYVHDGNYTKMFWLKDESCGSVTFPECAKYISSENLNFYSTQEYAFDKPSGADSFMFTVRTDTTYTDQDNPATVMSNMGFTITFNPPVDES